MSDAPAPAAPTAPSSSPAASGTGAANPGASDPTPAGAVSTSPPAPKPGHRIKYEGQEVEVSDADVPVLLSKGYASEQRFQQAAKLRKEAEEKERAWAAREAKLKSKEQLADVLREYGHDFDTLAAERVIAKYQAETAGQPQEAPEVRELREKLERYESQEKERVAAEQKAKAEEIRTRQAQEFSERFAAGLETLKIEPGNNLAKALVRRMAYHQELALDGGWDMPAESLARLAKQDLADEAKFVFGGLEGDQLLDELGDELVAKVTRAAVARLQKRKAGGSPPVPAPVTPGTAPPPAKGQPQRNANGQFVASTDRAFDRFMRIGGLDD